MLRGLNGLLSPLPLPLVTSPANPPLLPGSAADGVVRAPLPLHVLAPPLLPPALPCTARRMRSLSMGHTPRPHLPVALLQGLPGLALWKASASSMVTL